MKNEKKHYGEEMKRKLSKILFTILICICFLFSACSDCKGCKGIGTGKKEEKEPFQYVHVSYPYEDEDGYKGYRISAILEDVSKKGVLYFPDSYMGEPVVWIGGEYGDELKEEAPRFLAGIYEVHIPASVKRLDTDAFYGMENLKKVVFAENSTLTYIGEYAFRNCRSLSSVSLPVSVENVSPKAFYNTDVYRIDVAWDNPYLADVDGVLTNKEGWQIICYPYGRTDLEYIVPNSITDVEPYAFYGNKYLQKLDLNKTVILRKYALQDTVFLENIQTDSLRYVEEGALEGSLWLNNKLSSANASISLGRVLVRYRGDSKTLGISGITSIAPRAFAGNETLELIHLHSDLINVGDEAFMGCTNLKKVLIDKNNGILFIGIRVFDDNAEGRVISVPQPLLEEYRTNSLWQQYLDALSGYDV